MRPKKHRFFVLKLITTASSLNKVLVNPQLFMLEQSLYFYFGGSLNSSPEKRDNPEE